MNAFTKKPDLSKFLRTQQDFARRSQHATQQAADPKRRIGVLKCDLKKVQVKK